MQIWLLIATLVAPALFAYKHNQQARHVLEGRLHKRNMNQDLADLAFKDNKNLFKSNALIVSGADLGILTLFFYENLNVIFAYLMCFVSVVLLVSGLALKVKAISQIHQTVMGGRAGAATTDRSG